MIETNDINFVAGLISEKIDSILKKKEYLIMGFPGGRSIGTLTEALKKETTIDWSRIHIFMVDERLVDINDKESNFRLIYDIFLNSLVISGKLPEKNIHPFKVGKSPGAGLESYVEEFNKFGGKFDIAFFGVGEDGHVGGLFPARSVNRGPGKFLLMDDSPKPPKDRMTLTKECFLDSGLAVLLFIGEGKKLAYAKFNDRNIDYKECPAKLAFDVQEAIIFENL